MNYYLVKTEKLFIDPHGDIDDGGEVTEVFKTKTNINTSYVYKDQIHQYSRDFLENNFNGEDMDEDEIWQDDEELYGSEDGYNMIYHRVYFKKITEEQYNEYEQVIKKYNSL